MYADRRFHFLSPYLYLVRFIFAGLLLLTISRCALMLWQFERVSAAANLTQMVLQGIRADFIVLCAWSLLLVLLAPFLAHAKTQTRWYQFNRYWCWLGLVILMFMELATPAFLQQYDLRPNRLFIEYLKYPKEVFSMLLKGFTGVFIGGIALTGGFAWLTWRQLAKLKKRERDIRYGYVLITWPLILLVLFMGIRSTTQHRPANPAFFAFTGDAMVNSLTISSLYSVAYAAYSLKNEASSSDMYGKMEPPEIMARALNWPWLKTYQFNHDQYPSLHVQQATHTRDKPLNLVIVLQESLGATFVQSLDGVAVTPELENLKSQGMWFHHLFATGTRSVRGIEAVVSGFFPTPAQSVVKLSNSQSQFATLASVLAHQGYLTQFAYGGEAHFDNMRNFFVGNGFQQVLDLNKFENPVFVGSWGASDEDLFNAAHQSFEAFSRQNKPFFSLVFTTTNHSPFEFPDGRIDLVEQPKNTVNNAVKYADWAMGRFFDKARASDYWKNTVFLIVADHDNRVYGDNLIPVEKFRIPGLILGADIAPAHINTLASQVDLAPTLLSLMGVTSCHPFAGRDFTLDATSPGRAMLQFGDYFALMQEDQQLTLLEPNGKALRARYDETHKKLTLEGDAQEEARLQALATVQMPSYLYRQRLYPAPKDCQPSNAH